MGHLRIIADFFLHLDFYLGQIIATYGMATYAIMFVIIFIETGLVVTPFLPGDSLLFTAGAFAALGSLNVTTLLFILALAAILGDTTNYWIGHFFGEQLIANPKIPIKKEYIKRTEDFFQKYGGKTITLARFVPIVRTFAPFVAGVGKMEYKRFLTFNVAGGIAWVMIAVLSGYFFGNIPLVKNNFSFLILGIVLISIAPMVVHLFRRRRHNLK